MNHQYVKLWVNHLELNLASLVEVEAYGRFVHFTFLVTTLIKKIEKRKKINFSCKPCQTPLPLDTLSRQSLSVYRSRTAVSDISLRLRPLDHWRLPVLRHLSPLPKRVAVDRATNHHHAFVCPVATARFSSSLSR